MAAHAYKQYLDSDLREAPGKERRFSQIAVDLLPVLKLGDGAMTAPLTEALDLLQQLSLDSPKSADAVRVLRQLHVKGFRLAVDRQNGDVRLDEAGFLRLVTAIIREAQFAKIDDATPAPSVPHGTAAASSSLSSLPSIPGYNPIRPLEWYQEMQQSMHDMLAKVDQVRANKSLTSQARFNAENALWADFQTKYPSELKCGVDIFSDQFATP
jgi:hypothetical protein